MRAWFRGLESTPNINTVCVVSRQASRILSWMFIHVDVHVVHVLAKDCSIFDVFRQGWMIISINMIIMWSWIKHRVSLLATLSHVCSYICYMYVNVIQGHSSRVVSFNPLSSFIPSRPRPPAENIWWVIWISCHKGVSCKCLIIVPRMRLSDLVSICCSICIV